MASTFSLSIYQEVMVLDSMILGFFNVDFHFNKEPQTLGVEKYVVQCEISKITCFLDKYCKTY